MTTILLALDQSSRVSGYAIFQEQELVTSGTFAYTDSDMGKRLFKIREHVKQLIQVYEVNELAFEDIQMQGGNVVTYRALAETLGVLEELAAELGIKYTIVPAVTWRSTLGIQGRVRADQKRSAQEYALKTYQKQVSEDESDAICIGAHMLKTEKSAF